MLSMQRVRRPAREACNPAFVVLLLSCSHSVFPSEPVTHVAAAGAGRLKAFT